MTATPTTDPRTRTAPHGDAIAEEPPGHRAILIPQALDEEIREVKLRTDRGDAPLSQLQELVGGMIQGLPFPARLDRSYGPGEGGHHEVAGVYVNEDGKYDAKCRVNERATTLMFKGGLLFPGDWVAGNLIVVGTDPRTGATCDAPADVTVEAIEQQTASL